MTGMQDDDIRDAFQALRADDAATAPPLGRVTKPSPARLRRAWIGWTLVPAAAAIALVVLARGERPALPNAEVVRQAGAWRSPTDFLLETGTTDALLRQPSVLPDLNLRLVSPPPAMEHDS